MTSDQALALVGIVITVILAAAGFLVAKKVRRKSMTLKQAVRGGGAGLQAGRDLKAGNVVVGKGHD